METSDAEAGMVDCGVGTIVWVRRRNGSWWPGKILGPDELSASHVMSPRSGTPVKLLGREDASVDWYNLEKSKRVKPFRCGEFDDCIERAEASQGMPPKKREKYARREDAILHALELEKQLLEKKYGKLSVQSKLLGKDKSITSYDNGSSKLDNLSSLEEKRKSLSVRADSDDKSPDLRPRLRGLQDLGVGVGPLPIPSPMKYKASSTNGSHKHVTDGELTVTPVSNTSLLEKRKWSESHEGSMNMEETMNKRRDRRRPLVQVLKSSAKLPPPQAHIQHPSLQLQGEGDDGGNDHDPDPDPGLGLKAAESFETVPVAEQLENLTPKFEKRVFDSFSGGGGGGLSEENNSSGSNEDTETDSSGTESLISDTYDATAALSDEGEHIEFIPKAFGRSEENESMSDDESDDSGDSAPTTVSKWQLKGKRNSRKFQDRKLINNHNHWMSFKEEEEEEDGYNKGYWEQSPAPVYVSLSRMLIDVEVQVQSGYQREHVPMISLMSKLNDKAIVGHPLPIETLEDGASDVIILTRDFHQTDESAATLQPWRTARRTAKSRVPRLSTLEEEQQYVIDDKSRKPLKKPHQRKATSSCSQKTRTLSSLPLGGGSGTHHHHHHQQKKQSLDVKGEEKPESLPTAVACIPVKLVFSRLHEELVARHQ